MESYENAKGDFSDIDVFVRGDDVEDVDVSWARGLAARDFAPIQSGNEQGYQRL